MSPIGSAATGAGALPTLGGVLCALFATSCYNLGPAVQKKALNHMPSLASLPLSRQLALLFSSRRWILGLVIGLLGVVPFSTAIALSGIAVVQPLMGFGIAVMVWYGSRRLGERLSRQAILGVGFLILLPALISFSAVSPPVRILGDSISPTVFFLCLAGFLIGAGAFFLIARRVPLAMAVAVVLLYTFFPLCLQAIIGLLRGSGYHPVRDLGTMADRFFREPRLWGSLLLFLLGAGTNGVGYYLLQIGLQRSPATRFNPLVNSGCILAGTGLGILFYGQRIGQPVVYALAMGLAIGGIVLLSAESDKRLPRAAAVPAGGSGSGESSEGRDRASGPGTT